MDFLKTEKFHRYEKIGAGIAKCLFPVILFLFPLCNINQGIDLTDTAYSLGNYRFFEQTDGLWMMLTFWSNVLGSFFTKLPFGKTMLGMNLYSSLLISFMALFGYRFFKTKMPSWLAFLGEMAAIGLCWCPSVILYNYLTYVLFLIGAVLLFRGLAGCRPVCLVLAGVCLGLNVNVRFPGNVLEAALILALWYYGYLKKKPVKEILKETGLCVAGYVGALLGSLFVLMICYGFDAYGRMISGVFGMTQSASDYTFGEMILSILDAYFHGFQWMLYMILCILPGIPFMVIGKEKYVRLKKMVYCLCIAFLFFVLGRWGMYNFRYYQKESALQWGAIFLLLGIAVTVWLLFTKAWDDEWKLIGCIALITILITPLGSNNYIWPILNNLFFAVPVVFWVVYRFVRWGRTYLDTTRKVPLFSAKAMVSAVLIAFWIQAVGVGACYVFLDGEGGENRDEQVADNPVLAGMYTTGANAGALEEISAYFTEKGEAYEEKGLILYGNIPGLSYYLDRPAAIYTTWPDLDSNSLTQLQEELSGISEKLKKEQKEKPKETTEEKTGTKDGALRPLVIITPQLAAYYAKDAKAMEFWGTDEEVCAGDEKLLAIMQFMRENQYEQVFFNEAFAVYE